MQKGKIIPVINASYYTRRLYMIDRQGIFRDFMKVLSKKGIIIKNDKGDLISDQTVKVFLEMIMIAMVEENKLTILNASDFYEIWKGWFPWFKRDSRISFTNSLNESDWKDLLNLITVTSGKIDSFMKKLQLNLDLAIWKMVPFEDPIPEAPESLITDDNKYTFFDSVVPLDMPSRSCW